MESGLFLNPFSTDRSFYYCGYLREYCKSCQKDAHINGYFEMKLNMNGKRALVTGASAGIGKGTAKVLAGFGVKCVIAARRILLL